MSIVKNAGYNLVAAIVPVALSLIILPFYIHTIGPSRYGMVALIGALVGYFGVFDLGLSAAVIQRIAASRSDDYDARRRIFWTAASINISLGVLGGLLILPVAQYYAAHGLNTPPALVPEIRIAMWWLALALPVALLNGVLRGALLGAERFLEYNAINIVVGTISQVTPLAAALLISPSLSVVLPALYLTRLLNIACFGWVIATRVLRSWVPRIDRGRIGDLLSFGGWVTLSSLLSPLVTTIDRYLIGAFINLRSVSYYTVPYQMAERTMIVPSALSTALFPRVAGAHAGEAQKLGSRALHAIAAVMGPPMVAGVVVMHPLMNLWIGRSFADESAVCGQILLAGFWWNALGYGAFAWLYGNGRAKAVAIAHLIETVPYFIVLYLGLKLFGLPGAAVAFAFRVALDAVLLAGMAGMLREMLRLSAIATIAFVAALRCSLPLDGITMHAVLLSSIPVLLTSAVSMLWLYSERESMLGLLRQFRRRRRNQPEIQL